MRIGVMGLMAFASAPALAVAQTSPAPGTAAAQPAKKGVDTAPVVTTPAASAPQAGAPQTPPVERRPAAGDDVEEAADIVVNGQRTLPGSAIGDIPPEVSLSPADIRSYGVNSVSDLLTELGPQIQSGRGEGGPPVVLVNGRRISGFQEIQDLPTEAIVRVDILPEEVALKYGYRADQRVVNFVLARRFRAATLEAADRIPTSGGSNQAAPQVDLLNIRNGGRANIHVAYTEQSALTEAERDIAQSSTLFTPGGNVVGVGGSALDPRLGDAAVAGVPASAATGRPAITDFVGTAGQQTSAADLGRYRTLQSASRQLSLNGVYARPIGTSSITVNGRLDVADSTGLNGLPIATLTLPAGNPYSPFAGPVQVDRALTGFDALKQRNASINGHVGATASGAAGGWQWSLVGSYDRISTSTDTGLGLDLSPFQTRLVAGSPAANPFAPLTLSDVGALPSNRAYSLSSVGEASALISGSPISGPAGRVTTSIRVGGSTADFDSRSYRTIGFTRGDVSRDSGSASLNVDVPLTSVARGFLSAIGNLSINGNIEAERLSDFGTLTTYGYGLNWSPLLGVRIIASHTDDQNAPSAQQLGNPVVQTPNVRVFDYVTGTTATVTTITGGNPNLVANERHVTKVGVTLKPFTQTDFTFTANYNRVKTDNPIQGFPAPTAAIEAAFPGRFVRGAGGQLVSLDTRPINFARRERSELRYGFNFSHPLKSRLQKQIEAFRNGTGPNPFEGLRGIPGFRGPGQGPGAPGGPGGGASTTPPTPPMGEQPGSTQPVPARQQANGGGQQVPAGGRGPGGFGGGGFGGRGGGGGRGGFGGGRLQFAVYHTWHFTDRVDVGTNGPFLDLLDGDAIGQRGGQPRHEVEVQAGVTNNGLGARLSANYQSGSTVNGGTAAVPSTLTFGSLTTANLRLFVDAGGRLEWLKAHPWLRGTRLTLSVDNVFNTRQQVTDAAGTTPISLQPGYLDPLGRTVRLSIRKLFF